MKKILVFLLPLFLVNVANAGFQGTGNSVTSVQEALSAKDDTYLELTGYIVKSLGKEKYRFEDSTGHIIVEIDEDDWNGQTVIATDLVRIRGEIDKGRKHSKIEVDTITKL